MTNNNILLVGKKCFFNNKFTFTIIYLSVLFSVVLRTYAFNVLKYKVIKLVLRVLSYSYF